MCYIYLFSFRRLNSIQKPVPICMITYGKTCIGAPPSARSSYLHPTRADSVCHMGYFMDYFGVRQGRWNNDNTLIYMLDIFLEIDNMIGREFNTRTFISFIEFTNGIMYM